MIALNRTTVILSDYPDLVVIYLGMRVEQTRGPADAPGARPADRGRRSKSGPDGLPLHEQLMFAEEPLHWACVSTGATSGRSRRGRCELPHKDWWSTYLRDRGGTSFRHETYFRRGGIESMYVDVGDPLGLTAFAPAARPEGPMFSARARAEADRAAAT